MRLIILSLGILLLPVNLIAQSVSIPELHAEYDDQRFPNIGKFNAGGEKEGNWTITQLMEGPLYISAAKNTEEKALVRGRSFLIQAEGQFVNGLREGVWTLSLLKKSEPIELIKYSEQSFRKDVPVGEWHFFDLSGKKVVSYRFNSEGEKLEVIRYFENGQISEKVLMDKGSSVNKWYQYDTHGTLLSEATLVDSILKGPVKVYYPTGELQLEGNWENEQYEGEIIEYWKNGQLAKKYTYANGVLNGKYSIYSEEGILQSDQHYVNDQPDGLYRYYHPNGQIWISVSFSKGRIGDVLASYDQHGNEREKGTLKNGVGTVYYYHADGKLREIITYKAGKPVSRKQMN